MLDESVLELNVPNVKTREEALAYLADKLYEKGIVKDTYKEAVIEREKIFPTGLQFSEYGIAIPHTDVEHVKKAQIAVMTLEEPVIFSQMASADIQVPVKIIVMLALKEAHSQLEMLQKIMELLQDSESMNEIQKLQDSKEDKQKLLDILANKEIN